MTEPSRPGTTRRIAIFLLRGLLGIALLILLFQYVDFTDVIDSISKARFEYLAGALVLVAANLGTQVLSGDTLSD